MNTELSEVVRKLKARKSGSGWLARCPAHEDHRESLSIGEGHDGRLLVNCHAGCSFDAIRQKLGLESKRNTSNGAPARREEARYAYKDEDKKLLYTVIRYEPKDFRVQAADGTWSLKGIRRVPYRLPLLRKMCSEGRIICIVEGEKDVDNLCRAGIPATTIAGGVKGIIPENFADYFNGAKSVTVLPDNDEPGREFAERVASLLHEAKVPVRIVELPGLPPKGDASDWLAAGGTQDQLAELEEAAELWQPAKDREVMATHATQSATSAAVNGPRASNVVVHGRWLSDVAPERVDWLWNGYVPFGFITILEGDPKLSKSTLTTWLAAKLSSGGALPDGSRHKAAVSLFLTYEDSAAITVRPRAEAHGADVSRIKVLDCVTLNGEEQLFSLPEHVAAIRAEVEATGARLLVVDPLSAALSGEVNSYKDTDVRRALAPLKVLAEDTGIAIVVVRHLTKAAGRNAIHAGGGSIAIAAAARMVLAVHKDPNDEKGDRRVLAVSGTNLGKIAPSRAYSLVPDLEREVARIEWGEEIQVSADELTAARGDDDDERSVFEDAVEFLREALAPGPRIKQDVMSSAQKERFSPRTLQRAAKSLGVKTVRNGFGKPATWELPVAPFVPKDPSFAKVSYIGTTGKNGDFGKNGESEQAATLFETPAETPAGKTGNVRVGGHGVKPSAKPSVEPPVALIPQDDRDRRLLRVENGTRYFDDGSQELTPERIEEIRQARIKALQPPSVTGFVTGTLLT